MLWLLCSAWRSFAFFFFFNDTATTEIYTLSLHDALPICSSPRGHWASRANRTRAARPGPRSEEHTSELQSLRHLVCRLLLEKKKTYRDRIVRVANHNVRPCRVLHESSLCSLRAIVYVHFARCFFFNDTATTEIYTLSLHDALPI